MARPGGGRRRAAFLASPCSAAVAAAAAETAARCELLSPVGRPAPPHHHRPPSGAGPSRCEVPRGRRGGRSLTALCSEQQWSGRDAFALRSWWAINRVEQASRVPAHAPTTDRRARMSYFLLTPPRRRAECRPACRAIYGVLTFRRVIVEKCETEREMFLPLGLELFTK